MRAEILMIGTELLLGQIQDTNATYMAQVLAENGINIYQKTTVGDNRERILGALRGALERSDLVLCSGGLGPTEDDITRECVAELFDRELVYHEEIFEAIAERFRSFKREITPNNKKQALVPQGGRVLENPHGTAPGILVEDSRGVVACMPGVPSELKPMLSERILPYLRERWGMQGVLHYQVLKVCGMGESRVDSIIGDLITTQSNPTVGLLASPDAVRIRIAARAASQEAAAGLIAPVEAKIRERLPGLILGANDDTLESVVDELFTKRGWRLRVAETNTGGMVMARLVSAGVACLEHGEVLPLHQLDSAAPAEAAVALSTRILVNSPDCCALALVANLEERRTEVVFRTPEGVASWEVAFYGRSGKNQQRTSAIALEFVRRCLSGHPDFQVRSQAEAGKPC